MTLQQLENKVKILEQRLCCGKPLYYSTFEDFPETGKDNTLYVDEETGAIYIWNGTEYITAEGGGGIDRFHTNIVGTAPYDPLLPLTGWVAPSSPIAGNTAEVKFTDGTVGNYTFDGTDWVLDFQQTWAEQRIYLNTASPAFTPLNALSPTEAEAQAWVDANLTDAEKVTTEVYYNFVDEVIFDEVIYYPETTTDLNSGPSPTTQVLTSITINGVTTAVGLDSLDAANYASINTTVNAAIVTAGYSASAKILKSATSSRLYLKQFAGNTPLVITMSVLKNGVATTRTATNTPVIDYPEQLFNGSVVWSVINGTVKEIRNDYKDFTLVASARARVPAFNAAYHKEGTTFVDTQYDSTYVSNGTAWINTVEEKIIITVTSSTEYIAISGDENDFSIYWKVAIQTNRTQADHDLSLFLPGVPALTPTVSSTNSYKTIYNGINFFLDERHLTTTIPSASSLLIKNNATGRAFDTIVKYTVSSSNFSGVVSALPIFTDRNGNVIATTSILDSIRLSVSDAAVLLPTKTEQTLPRLLNLTTVERDTVVLAAGDAGKVIFNTTAGAIQVWNGVLWI